jgi:hypothetical protein
VQPGNPANATGPDDASPGNPNPPAAAGPAADPGAPAWVPSHPPYVRRPTNSMAIASMITGIVGLMSCPVLGVIAVYLGKRAREEIRTAGEDGDGLAIVGLVTGWIGIGLSALTLIGFLLVVGYALFVGAAVFTAAAPG